ncbi:MAG: immunity 17 family protein [Anaerolineaceae bacterium]|nr:immunity 17 family protein [Anaerolineaceae bacterium]
MNNANVIFIPLGLLMILVSFANPDWYFNMPKTRFLVSILGRTGTRVFNGILGLLVMYYGFV